MKQIGESLLDFQRSQALKWLENKLKESSDLTEIDRELDQLIRIAAKLPAGNPYGFVRVPANQGKAKILLENIPFWHQLDNYRGPHRTCFSSTGAMFTEHFKPNALDGDNAYLKVVFSYGDTTDPNAQLKALKHFGIDASYSQKLDFEDLDRNLEDGNPVAIGFLHRGSPSHPTGGHWALVVGRTQDCDAYIFNDPYGCIPYNGPIELGHHVEYSKTMLRNRWLVEGKNSGWGITIAN